MRAAIKSFCLLLGALPTSLSFAPTPEAYTRSKFIFLCAQKHGDKDDGAAFSHRRRDALLSPLALVPFLVGGGPTAALAKGPPPRLSDEDKIRKGYERLNFLLDNWEKETTVCGRTDNPYLGCERTPEKVMEYLGFKSMDDPLFRADKTLIRLQGRIPPGDDEATQEYQDAIDTWMEKAEEGSGMAFVSSWGEANPGGGKDRVELFIERSKKDVIEARDCLGTAIRILKL